MNKTLNDYKTGAIIGPATEAQIEASRNAGRPEGTFCIDADGDPCEANADPAVFGPLRTVWVS